PLLLVSGARLPAHGRGVYLSHLPGDNRPMPASPREYAAVLYLTLHNLDSEGHDWIAVEWPPDTPEWAGIRDRLKRASST
ncbi:MAG: translation factor SUA5, partial [Bryobacteraceae bacterium]|nr:translation factor SUA5 [Bryobacteraceae bacterium]